MKTRRTRGKTAAASAAALILALAPAALFGQSFGSADNWDLSQEDIVVDDQRGFTAQVDVDANLFQWDAETFSRASERNKRTDYGMIQNMPFGGFNVLDDTNIGFAYNGDWYGGSLTVTQGDVLSGIKGWVSFFDGALKISAGNSIGYGYADAQGAGAGLRVYDDNVRNSDHGVLTSTESTDMVSSKNPDNITGDQGVLVEVDLDPLKIALAGGGNVSDLAADTGSHIAASNADAIYGHSFRYGANAGYRFGDFGKVNAAYFLQSVKTESWYEYVSARNEIVAMYPDSEVNTHLFGLFGSVYPFGNDTLGVTAGYAGEFVQYLDEFRYGETAQSGVLKHGINLMARWQTAGENRRGKLTLRTDHNYSFWTDKNYRVYNLYKADAQRFRDYGFLAKSNDASDVSEVTHTFLWNGIGASYWLTNILETSVYARNLMRRDETPEYALVTDLFEVELKATFHLTDNVEAYAGFVYKYGFQTADAALAAQAGEFKSGTTPGETTDTSHNAQIPLGFRVKLRR